jgi:hypothetical protein
MNANNTAGRFFRVVNAFGKSLSPNAHLVLLYLYRQYANLKVNPFFWRTQEAQIDARTLRKAEGELRKVDLLKSASCANICSLTPMKERRLCIRSTARSLTAYVHIRFHGSYWTIGA